MKTIRSRRVNGRILFESFNHAEQPAEAMRPAATSGGEDHGEERSALKILLSKMLESGDAKLSSECAQLINLCRAIIKGDSLAGVTESYHAGLLESAAPRRRRLHDFARGCMVDADTSEPARVEHYTGLGNLHGTGNAIIRPTVKPVSGKSVLEAIADAHRRTFNAERFAPEFELGQAEDDSQAEELTESEFVQSLRSAPVITREDLRQELQERIDDRPPTSARTQRILENMRRRTCGGFDPETFRREPSKSGKPSAFVQDLLEGAR